MRRPFRPILPILGAALLVACLAREPDRPPVRLTLLTPDPRYQSQVAVPLNTPDPRYAEYFAELKRRIEEKWSYPAEAARKGQSGQGELRFVLRNDGSVRIVEIVSSSGVRLLDSYIENAIRLASPFPPIPASIGEDVIPISFTFTYALGVPR